MKPKPNQFKGKGQTSKGSQQKKPGKAPNAGRKDSNACHFCGKSGHKQRDCFVFKEWLKNKGTDVITFVEESLYVNYATNTWWIDSGATIHIAN